MRLGASREHAKPFMAKGGNRVKPRIHGLCVGKHLVCARILPVNASATGYIKSLSQDKYVAYSLYNFVEYGSQTRSVLDALPHDL